MMTATIQEYELHAYLDGELSPEDASDLEARLENDPDAEQRLIAFASDKALVTEALSTLEAPTENLRTRSLQKKLARIVSARMDGGGRPKAGFNMKVPLQIAAVLAVFAVGWGWSTNTLPGVLSPLTGTVQTAAVSMPAPEFVLEAIGAHQVFADDTTRPVEISANMVPAAAAWFSQKLGTSVSPPSFEHLNMALVGARMLGTKEGALIQYIYEDPAGARLSLTMSKHLDAVPEYKLQTVDQSDRMAGYWTEGDIDYVLVSGAQKDQFEALIKRVAQSG